MTKTFIVWPYASPLACWRREQQLCCLRLSFLSSVLQVGWTPRHLVEETSLIHIEGVSWFIASHNVNSTLSCEKSPLSPVSCTGVGGVLNLLQPVIWTLKISQAKVFCKFRGRLLDLVSGIFLALSSWIQAMTSLSRSSLDEPDLCRFLPVAVLISYSAMHSAFLFLKSWQYTTVT